MEPRVIEAEARLPRVCVLGAGSSGIACCKVLHAAGIPFTCFEAGDRVGGMWVFRNSNGMSSAYRSLHINTSRRRMAYSDFPMPESYPDFPGHAQIASYFDAYVDHFGFRDAIRFRTRVEQASRREGGGFRVRLDDGTDHDFDALVVANGHHWYPNWPEPDFPGTFAGDKLHSHHYLDPDEPLALRGKKVVVIGFGNSAMDIACELGQRTVASEVYLSTRSGGHVFPKYLGSMPVDELLRHPSEAPSWTERFLRTCVPESWVDAVTTRIYRALLRMQAGEPTDYGLPEPKQPFGHSHPTISSEIHIRLGSGDVIPKPDVARFDGRVVQFVDGSRVEADAVIYATGYRIRFPFFDRETFEVVDNDVALFQRVVDPRYPDLFFLGLVQPLCAMMPIAEEQSKWIAEYLAGRYHLPPVDEMQRRMVDEHERMKAKFTSSRRHTIEIDCQKYTYDLWRETAQGRKRAKKAGLTLPVPRRG